MDDRSRRIVRDVGYRGHRRITSGRTFGTFPNQLLQTLDPRAGGAARDLTNFPLKLHHLAPQRGGRMLTPWPRALT